MAAPRRTGVTKGQAIVGDWRLAKAYAEVYENANGVTLLDPGSHRSNSSGGCPSAR